MFVMTSCYFFLMSQVLNEVYKLEIHMPKITEIPSWFDHRCEGGIVSFWARQKFPVVAVAFIFKNDAIRTRSRIRVYINGHDCDAYDFSSGRRGFAAVRDHVLLFDLRCLLVAEERPILNTFQVSEWNHVEVECECACESESECECDYDSFDDVGKRSNVSYWGAYVYKKETNMEDIQFRCPNLLKRTLSIVYNPSKRKRVRKLKPKSRGKDK